MPGRKYVPKNEKEELLYYKGVYQIRELIGKRIEIMEKLAVVDKDIAKIVVRLRAFLSWGELGEMLGMTEAQAQRYLSPLMEEFQNETYQR